MPNIDTPLENISTSTPEVPKKPRREINTKFPPYVPDPGGRRWAEALKLAGLGVNTLSEYNKLLISKSANPKEVYRIMMLAPMNVPEALMRLKLMGEENFLAAGFNLTFVNSELGEGWTSKWS